MNKADEVEITWALSDIVLFYCLKDKSAFKVHPIPLYCLTNCTFSSL